MRSQYEAPVSIIPVQLPTFAAPPGPSNFAICSFACLGKSTVLVLALARPNRNDMLSGFLNVGACSDFVPLEIMGTSQEQFRRFEQ